MQLIQTTNEKYTKIVYQEKEYVIFHKYDSGYCELKEKDGWGFLLVPETELVKPHKQST